MIYRRNRFSSEVLYQISSYLSFKDYYHCLYVCWFWHHIFLRALYKRIIIQSGPQLRRLIASLRLSERPCYNGYHPGLFIEELYLGHRLTDDTLRRNLDVEVHISQNDLELLSVLCPRLKILDFDISQWEHLSIDSTIMPWHRLQQCAPIYFCHLNTSFLTSFNGSKLVELTILHRWEKLDSLVTRLNALPALTKLTLEVVDGLTGASSEMTQSLQTIHTLLPHLRHLSFICNSSPRPEASSIATQDPRYLSPFSHPSQLKSLLLHGHVDSIKWFNFIATSYPSLESLSLTNLSSSKFGTKWMWQTALVHMLQKLPLLKTLSLGGENISQLFSSSFAFELKKPTCSIQDVSIDLNVHQAIESCQFLLFVAAHGIKQLKHLKLHVWEQLPGWPGTTPNLFKCQYIVSLELSLSAGLTGQLPYTSFLINRFLQYMLCLQDFVLVGASVQVTRRPLQELLECSRKLGLQKIRICQSKIEDLQTMSRYLSCCCPNLQELSLEECKADRKEQYQKALISNNCYLDFMYSDLARVDLSSCLVYVSSAQANDFIGIQLVTPKSYNSKVPLDQLTDFVIYY
ncbi:hypothetical protein BD560DRAFT_404267 [Blakeslea trispora]|nr:hypothetical protein BD560DRAFT_404267 [Blakeslea trispora]